MNIFTKTAKEYVEDRDLNVYKNAVLQSAEYLAKISGKPIDDCIAYVKKETSSGGKFEIKDPEMLVLERDSVTLDKEPKQYRFTQFLKIVSDRKHIMAPTMTVYYNPNERKSFLSDYVVTNMKQRSIEKKKGQVAEQNGDVVLAGIQAIIQTSKKVKNNGMSGAFASKHNPLYNLSAHSSLTSICRLATATGNANNERLIAGNRHYWSHGVVLREISYILRVVDMDVVKAMVDKYDLVQPTTEHCMSTIERCTRLYWDHPPYMERIRQLIDSLTGYERAAFLYIQDMYNLAELNDGFVRQLLKSIITLPDKPLSFEEADAEIKSLDEDQAALNNLLNAKDMAGKTVYGKTGVRETDKVLYCKLGASARNVKSSVGVYADFIKAFWVSDYYFAELPKFVNIIRRCAVVSDTDSTIFTVQHWVKWYTGKIQFTEEAYSVSYAMVYLASQTNIHSLAIYSANMGVTEEYVFMLAMKNEYMFPVFVQTSKGKHYAAYMSAKEGNVFLKFKRELKGVSLRNSKVPPHIMKKGQDFLFDMVDDVMSGNGIVMADKLRYVSSVETEIFDSIKSGSYDYLRSANIKEESAYKQKEKAPPIFQYKFWNETIGKHYGESPKPPYGCVSLTMTTSKAGAMSDWLGLLDEFNPAMATDIRDALKRHGKKTIGRILIPSDIVRNTGIPDELLLGSDARQLVYAAMECFYLALESMGYYAINKNRTKLVSDLY